MPFALNGSTRIHYEVHEAGPGAPTLILIEGFTVQLIGWRPTLIARLVASGIRVVLMDNRDVGLSDKLPGVAYTVDDMADDVVAVADDLGVETFHIAGQSMGGMIAQVVLARHRRRIASLGLIYTCPALSPRWMRNPDSEQVGLDEAPDRDSAIETSVARERVSASPGYEFDEAWVRWLAGAQYDRCYDPSGYARQQAAMESFRDGVADVINGCDLPAAVIQGTADAYFLPTAAIELHRMLPNSELHLFPGMGHELVRPLLDDYARILARTVWRAEKA